MPPHTSNPDGWLPDELKLWREIQKPTLTIGVPTFSPWSECVPEDANCIHPGIGVDLTQAICRQLALHCQFQLINLTTSDLDPQLVLSEHILRKDVDTVVPILVPTFDRLPYLDYSIPVLYAEDAVMVKTQFLYPDDYSFLVKPFHPVVWLVIIMALIAVVFADGACRYAARRDSARRLRRQRMTSGSTPWRLYLREVESTSLYQMGILCSKNNDQPIAEWSRRLLIFSWGFASVLLCTTYSACLVSRRVAPEVITPFRTLREFTVFLNNAKPELPLLAVANDAHSLRQLQNWPQWEAGSASPDYEYFYRAISRRNVEYLQNASSAIKAIEDRKADEVILYGSATTLRYLARHHCNVSIIPLNVGQPLSFAFRKGSPQVSIFTKTILYFTQQGYFLERLYHKYGFEHYCDMSSDKDNGRAQTPVTVIYAKQQQTGQDEKTVHTMSLQLVFWALLCGYAAGALALMSEYLHKDVLCRSDFALTVGNRKSSDITDVTVTRF